MPSTYLGIALNGNGDDLWGVSPVKQLYRVDTSTGSILETISLPSIAGPIDLTWDGTNLWVSERDDVNFHQINENGSVLRTASAPNSPRGIAAQNPYIWVGTEPDSMLYRLDVGLPLSDVTGCINLKSLPLADRKVILKQKVESKQSTKTDANGCYEFESVVDLPLINVPPLELEF